MLASVINTMTSVSKALDEYQFIQATQQLYSFFWTDFCDWYVEVSKSKLKSDVTRDTCLAIQDLVIRQFLLMLHPVCPFITEELWHLMEFGAPDSFIQNETIGSPVGLASKLAARGIGLSDESSREVADVRESITLIRALKSEFNAGTNRNVRLVAVPQPEKLPVLQRHQTLVVALAGLSAVETVETAPDQMPAVVTPLGSFHLDLSNTIDVEKEKARLSKEIEKLQSILKGIESKLSNASFVNNAPAQVVEGARAQQEDNRSKLEQLQSLLRSLGES